MKYAFGVLELVIVIVVITILYFTCFHSNYGRSNPFEDNSRVNTQSQLIDDKIKDIESTKALKDKIEKNLREGN